MKHFLKIADGFDVKPVLAELEAHPELWDQHTIRKTAPGTPHSRMSDIWVRYNDVAPFKASGDYSTFNDAHVPVWYDAWEKCPSLHDIVFSLMRIVEGEMLGGVLITRIPAGLGIDPHRDAGWHVDHFDKFYVSLQSPVGAVFGTEVGGESEVLSPKAGECFLFDNRKMHWVSNTSNADRITLIVCIRTEKFGRLREEQQRKNAIRSHKLAA